MISKKCSRCLEFKLIAKFQIKNKKTKQRYACCRPCRLEEKKKYYCNNKKKFYRWNKDQRKRIKEKINNLKQILGCSSCKENMPYCLVFHHLSDKDQEISKMLANNLGKEKLAFEISKCIVLCANCHRKHHAGHLSVSQEAIKKDFILEFLIKNAQPRD